MVEIDGESHVGIEDAERDRQSALEQRGSKVLRFWDTEVYENLDGVLQVILQECESRV